MVRSKPKSKRQTTRHRVKVARKVREHNRKQRKEIKLRLKAGNTKAKQLKNDPGIPKNLPASVREEFMAKLKSGAEQEKVHRLQQRTEAEKFKALVRDATGRGAAFESTTLLPGQASKLSFIKEDNSRRAYMHDFRQVVAASDVVLEVLDARDPIGSRVHQLENLVLDEMAAKKIVLVLNKADLVPPEVRTGWLKYLRRQLPCLLFKSSTQEQRSHLGQTTSEAALNASTSECYGAESLMQLLKNYSRNVGGSKTRITVGVVGYPNVGKSSLINSLKRARVCKTGAQPGVTTSLQQVHLDSNIVLIDSPGVVFSTHSDQDSMILQNCVRIEQLDDPVRAVEAIYGQVSPSVVMSALDLTETPTSAEDLLRILAQRRGKVLKGGLLDIPSAARAVLMDWNKGKIPFYRPVPETLEDDSKDSLQIVSEWAPLFDLDVIYARDDQ
jgi:nuclear GTP-binding protein